MMFWVLRGHQVQKVILDYKEKLDLEAKEGKWALLACLALGVWDLLDLQVMLGF